MTDKRTELTEEDLVARYRATHPASRVVGITKYIHNSSRSRQRGCVLCGWSGPSWSADWPKTKGAIRAERDHIADHLRQATEHSHITITGRHAATGTGKHAPAEGHRIDSNGTSSETVNTPEVK